MASRTARTTSLYWQSDDSVAADYRKKLTKYAYSLVEKQLKRNEEEELEMAEDGCYKIKCTDSSVTDSKG